MSKMWKYIPPLASDYSGVCSILFAMESLLVLYSPGGCGQPIVEVDETRNLSDIYLVQTEWNDAEVVEGTEEKLIQDLKTMDLSRFAFISLIGTPIPDLMGVNLQRYARRIEQEVKKPVLVFATNGFESYPSGMAEGYLNLARRSIHWSAEDSSAIQINILGYNPLVWGEDRHLRTLLEYFAGAPLKVNVWGGGKAVFGNTEFSPQARLNLVITEEGVKLAEELQEKHGIPYLVKFPVGITEMGEYLKTLEKELAIYFPAKARVDRAKSKLETKRQNLNKKVLIIGEPFVSVALEKCLVNDFGIAETTVVSLVKKDTKAAELFANDRYVKVYFPESQAGILARAEQADIIIADPILEQVLQSRKKYFIPLPYCGLSGREFSRSAYDYVGIQGFDYLEKYFQQIV